MLEMYEQLRAFNDCLSNEVNERRAVFPAVRESAAELSTRIVPHRLLLLLYSLFSFGRHPLWPVNCSRAAISAASNAYISLIRAYSMLFSYLQR